LLTASPARRLNEGGRIERRLDVDGLVVGCEVLAPHQHERGDGTEQRDFRRFSRTA
jgi:hypothetical protein